GKSEHLQWDLHDITNGIGLRVISFATSRNTVVKNTDGTPVELLKTAGASFNRIFHESLTKIWSIARFKNGDI
uniref:Uncharacterized protein n=1 Tax=Megaselia scalaris TaxID=36166 RepID=T1GKE4_MEGSC